MSNQRKNKWNNLHKQARFCPKYPSEVVVQFIFRHFQRNCTEKILDLGCGAGRHITFLAREKVEPYGIDISNDGILVAQERLAQENLSANLIVGSVDKLPYENDFFDGLISYGVLYYCGDKEIKNSIKEIYRVLKCGGKGQIIVRNKMDYRYANATKDNEITVNEKDENRAAYNENGLNMHFFDEEELMQLFKPFTEVEIDTITETHNNKQYVESNYKVTFIK